MFSAAKNKPQKYFSFKTFGTVGDPVVFFFTAFMTKYWLYYPTIKKLTNAGYYVIVYDFNTRMIFDGEVEDYLSAAEVLLDTIKKQIADFKKEGVRQFFSYGTSMGTIFAIRIAIEIDDIKKVIVNLVYGSLIDSIWSWRVLRRIRKRWENKGMTKDQLRTLLKPISPLAMAPKLKGKKVLLYLSKNDKIILFRHSSQFKQALDKAGVEYIYYQNNVFGHIIGGSLNNFRSKIYLDFLKQE